MENVQPLFKFSGKVLAPVLPCSAIGEPMLPDGASVFTAEQAAAIIGEPINDVLEAWQLAHEAVIEMGGHLAAHETVRRVLFPHLNEDQFQYLLDFCHRRGLTPWAHQVWAKVQNGRVIIETKVEGVRAIAHRSGEYAGCDDVMFVEVDGMPTKATMTVYRMVNGHRHAYTHSVYWRDYCPADDDGFYMRMPHVMLGKCCEVATLKIAFPELLGNVYTPEEMAQARRSTPRRSSVPSAIATSFEPLTQMQFVLKLIDYGFQNPERRADLLKTMEGKFPGLSTSEPGRFQLAVFTCLQQNPTAYGAQVPEEVGA